MGKVFLFGSLILTNKWDYRTNILNISLDRNFPYIHDIVMVIRSVTPITLNLSACIQQYALCLLIWYKNNHTFSKLCWFPWYIFTHLSCGAKGLTSQTRTENTHTCNLYFVKVMPLEVISVLDFLAY